MLLNNPQGIFVHKEDKVLKERKEGIHVETEFTITSLVGFPGGTDTVGSPVSVQQQLCNLASMSDRFCL
jgi:hypothetical protein